jgi:ubiquinone/menaquinone biosynthesis C-methylase UbiE
MKIMNISEEKLSLSAKPIGLRGNIRARFMAKGHKTIYKNVAAALNLQPEDDYIEIGCGSGVFIKLYASFVDSVAGLDYSEDMVKLTTKINHERVIEGTAEFRQGDASQLPWKDKKFSAAAAIATFMFWPKPLVSLKEINRILRPGGRLVISLGWNADDGMNHTKQVKKYGIILYTGKEMQDMFKKAGFSESSITYSKGFRMPKLMIARAVK